MPGALPAPRIVWQVCKSPPRLPRPQVEPSYAPDEQKAWLKDASNAVKRHGFYLRKAIVSGGGGGGGAGWRESCHWTGWLVAVLRVLAARETVAGSAVARHCACTRALMQCDANVMAGVVGCPVPSCRLVARAFVLLQS